MRKHQIIRLSSVLTIVLSCVAVLLFADFASLADRIKARGYTPSTELNSLIQDLRLTSRAKNILFATHPAIYTEEVFNKYCQAERSELAVLGCYTNDTVYLFNIDNVELTGVKQSTLAHEMLHAVWARLPKSTQESLIPALRTVYNENLELLEKRINNYPTEERDNELHSIIGTEIIMSTQAACPENSCNESIEILREHYSKYFNDQSSVVAFYARYYSKFSALEKEAEQIYAQITTNKEAIVAQTQNCEDGIDELNAAISDFNRRAENGYFASAEAFNAERALLVKQQENLENLYKALENLVANTNNLIEKYNNNIAHTRGLLDSIDSTADSDQNINQIED